MATYLPPTFRWMPPTLETRLTDEPDLDEIRTRILYDHAAGRLGSDIRLALEGSDDDTRSSCRVRTQVGVRLAQAVGRTHTRTTVSATFRCEESNREFDHYDEAGLSMLVVKYRSKPFARLDLEPPLGAYVHGEPFFDAWSQHAEPTVLIGGGTTEFETDGPVTPGATVTFKAELDEAVPRRGLVVLVGMEDEVVAESDDTTYVVRLRSHWFLESVTLGTY